MIHLRLKKLLVVVVAFLLATFVAVACSAGSTEPPASTDSQATEADQVVEADQAVEEDQATEEEAITDVNPDEIVTIEWFMRWDQTRIDNVAMPVIEAFEAQHPNINVELENIGSGSEYYQKLQTMFAGGLAPDVFYPATHIAYSFASKGAVRFVDDFIVADGVAIDKFDQDILSMYQLEGQQYCLPIDTAALVVFYNKDMFDAAGISYPEDDWTWGDFLETAQALTVDSDGDEIIDQFGVAPFTGYWPLIVWSQAGHDVFDDTRNPTEFLLDEPAAIDAVQWLADLMNVHNVMPTSFQQEGIGDMFAAEKAAMNVVGHWRVPVYTANAEFEFDFAALPIGESPVNRADGSCFAISSTSEHPEEAWEFVKFLAGPGSLGVDKLLELQQMVPAITEFQNSDIFLSPPGLEDTNKEAFLAGENFYVSYNLLHPVQSEWEALWRQELGLVWSGDTTAREAIEYMAPLVDDMLANLSDYE